MLRRRHTDGGARRHLWHRRAIRGLLSGLVLVAALSLPASDGQAAAVEVHAEIVYETTTAFATSPDPNRCVIVWFAQFDAVENDDARSYTATLADGLFDGFVSDYTAFGPAYDDNYAASGGGIVVPFPPDPGTHRKVLNSYSTPRGCDDALAQTQGRWTLLAATADVPAATGSITIVAEAEQTGPSEGFVFTGSSPIGTFGLDTDPLSPLPDRRTFSDLEPATYTIQGTAPAGWKLATLTCRAARFALDAVTDPDAETATVTLPRDETVTCTYRYQRATALVVNSTRDLEDQLDDDESCDTGATITRNGADEPECTLRAAIQEADHQSGAQVIQFAIEGDPEIELASALPTVIGPVTIDGTSQGPSGSCVLVPACVVIRSSLDRPLLDVAGLNVTIGGLELRPTASTAIRVGAGGGHTITGNGVALDSSDPSLDGIPGIDVVGAQDVTIADNPFVRSSGPAIRLAAGSGHTVTGNSLRGSLLVTGSSDVTIGAGLQSPAPDGGNTVIEGSVLIADSTAVAIRGNTLGHVDVESGSDVRIEGNQIRSLEVGERASGVVIGGATPSAGTGPGNHIVSPTGTAITLEGDGTMIVGNLLEGARGENGCSFTQGILVQGEDNRIGGLTPNAANTIRGFDSGVFVQGAQTVIAGNVLENNSVGIDVGGSTSGTPCGTDYRQAHETTVSANVISGNGTGVHISPFSSGTMLQGNRIGTNAAGTAAAPNSLGVIVAGPAVVGGPSSGACASVCNVISGNDGFGIVVNKDDFLGLNAVTIQGNLIGVASDGSTPLPNGRTAISLAGGRSVTVGGEGPGEGNVIAHNGMEGVAVSTNLVGPQDSYGHVIRGNRIHSNGGLGIDLGGDGVTPNDIGDEDSGANDLQNFPEWREVRMIDGQVRITGRIPIHSTVQGTYLVDLYLNTRCDPSGHGEGELPYTTLSTTDFSEGFFTLDIPPSVLTGRVLTATATAPSGSTSEFSRCLDAEASAIESTLTAPAAAGATRLEVTSEGLVGKVVVIGEGATAETNYGAAAGSLLLAKPLRFAHAAGEPVVAVDDTLFVSLDRATITFSRRHPDRAMLSGTLRPVAGSRIACDEDVTLSLGGATSTRVSGKRFAHDGVVGCVFTTKTDRGVSRLVLDLRRGAWKAELIHRDLEGLRNPLGIRLRIGDDEGSELVRFDEEDGRWTYVR